MVEILLSFVLFVAAIVLTFWPFLGAHDHTIDGRFLTLTGSILSLLFLFNFVWQLRSLGANEVTSIRHAWHKLAQAIAPLHSKAREKGEKGEKDMKTIPQRTSMPLVMGAVLLMILAFPSSLYAEDLAGATKSSVPPPPPSHATGSAKPDFGDSQASPSRRHHASHGY